MPFFSTGGDFEDQTVQGGLVIKNQLATGVLLEDLDADGDLDLVVAFNGSGLRWWENNGRGQFGEMTPENFRSRTGPTSLAVADVDQNGLLDLYVANYGENTIRSGASVRTRMVKVSKSSPEDGGTALKSSMARWWSLGTRSPLVTAFQRLVCSMSWTEGRFLDASGNL